MSRVNTAPSLSATMLRLATGAWVSQAIYIAAKLGIADLLRDGNKNCGAIAEATNVHPGALYRLLRALASVDVFAEDGEGRFGLTPLADTLRTDAPASLRAFAIMLGEPEHWRAWGDALASVKTGQPAFDRVFGMPHFQYFSEHPEAGRIFNEAMASRAREENAAITAAYDFSGIDTIVDVGSGHGTLLAAILQSGAPAHCVLVDLPRVMDAARSAMERAGQASRCTFHAGDFFAAVPRGGDAYLLKKIIHDWDDERAIAILTNCRQAMTAKSRLLLIEPVIAPGNEPSFNKLLDLLMLVWTSGGRERTETEHRALLGAARFELARVVPTQSLVSILEAFPC